MPVSSPDRDAEAVAFRAAKLDRAVAAQPAWAQLNQRLLAFGGDQVVACYEEDLDLLLSDGALGAGPVRRQPGHPCRCHSNSSRLYEQDPQRLSIVTGWGLSADGLWRQHTWAQDLDGTIIETTTVRLRYYGVRLTGPAADRFAAANP